MASDIFFSYAREDEPRVMPLCKMLERHGWSVFWDRRIPAGRNWREYIGNVIASSRCVVVAWSSHSVTSREVMKEADEAERRNVLVPILLDRVDPPFGFRDINAADLSDWGPGRESAAFEELLKDIARMVGAGVGSSPPVEPATTPAPRAPVVASPPSPPPPAGLIEPAPRPRGAVEHPAPPIGVAPEPAPTVRPPKRSVASLLGVAPGRVQWRQVLAFVAALQATRLVSLVIEAPPANYFVLFLLNGVIHALVEAACALVALRFVSRRWLAVVVTGLSCAALIFLIGELRIIPLRTPPLLVFLRPALVLAGLIVAVEWIPSPGKALFVGYAGGSLVATAASVGLSGSLFPGTPLSTLASIGAGAAVFTGILVAVRPRGGADRTVQGAAAGGPGAVP